jgi:hypothetical protein
MFALAGVNRYISAGYDFQKLNLAVSAFSEAQIDVMFCAIVFSIKVRNSLHLSTHCRFNEASLRKVVA